MQDSCATKRGGALLCTKRVIALIISLAMLCWFIPAAAIPSVSWAEDTPTIPDGYTGVAISSDSELAALATAVNNGDTCSNKYYYLTNDIDLSSQTWTSIGKATSRSSSNGWHFEGNPFSGIFDGCGHTINGLYMEPAPATAWYEGFGLFGYTLDATIKNLGVVGQINATSATKAAYYGGIAGIAFCSLDTDGYASGNSTIDSCWSNVNISLPATGYAGGIAGYTGGGQSDQSNPLGTQCVFSNCYYKGTLTTTDTSRSVSLGGISGSGGGGFINCYFAGKMCSSMMKTSGKNTIFYSTISGDNKVENCYYKKAFYEGDGTTASTNWQGDSDATEITSSGLTAATMKGANWSDDAAWQDDDNIKYPGLVYTPEETDTSYNVTAATGLTGGSVSVDKTSAKAGETVTVTVSPNANYKISKVTYNDAEITPQNGVYSFEMPSKAVTVSAEFVRVYSVIVPSSITGGKVVADKTSAASGEKVTLTVTADTGFSIGDVKYNDNAITVSGGKYSFNMPAADATITATFNKINYNITLPSASDMGSVSVASTTANYGDTVTLIVSPVTGYELAPSSLKVVDSNSASVTVTNNTFTMPASNVTVSASFQKVVYSIANTESADGKITLDKSSANYRDTVTLTVEPGTGKKIAKDDIEIKDADGKYYQLDQVVDSDGKYTNKFTFKVPASNVTITPKYQDFSADLSMESYKFGETPANPVLTSDSNGDVTYVYTFADGEGSTNEQPALVGKYKVAAKIAASTDKNVLYGACETEAKEFEIQNGDQVLSGIEKEYTITAGEKANIQLDVKSNVDGAAITYKTSNAKVATVDAKGKVTFTGVGKATITVVAVADSYNNATATTLITVKAPSIAKVKLTKATKNKSKKKINVAWNKVKGVSGYQVCYKLGKKAKYKTAKASAKKLVIKKLKKGKKYNVTVRAYKKVYGKAVYGSWSKAKTIKIKK